MTKLAIRGALMGGVLALAGCVAPPATGPGAEPGMPPVMGGDCGAADLQYLMGQKARVLTTMRFSQPLRVLKPGMAVTMDYAPNRLNIELDAADTIIRVACG